MKTYEIGLLQSAAYRRLTNRTSEFLAEFSLTPNHWAILGLIYEEEVVRLTDVAAALAIRPASASELIQLLIEEGLVEREQNPDDRRVKDLTLTTSGEKFIENTEPKLLEHMQPLLADATKGSISGYIHTLRAITNNNA